MFDPAVCPLCKRPARLHGRKPKQWRFCGPVSGTGAGAMTADERARYVAGWPVKQS